ncbi:MAG TPA: PTS mannitol transporter subunit IIBC [Lachnoclostridium sp.]|jgi:PTS system mannitol-specific IIC component|uniref:PTS mannitol transporter subunit IICB n=1 Tax=Lacrimispora sp. TaxID=2719234 RepID=UPI000EC3228D|nr:PTS mannitol transporter subunit IICBA [Lacrimispora sp.]HCD45029.1 PTS mannitol transporter subunit IIBC [Lachnoclostridium sp.]
MKEKVQVFGRFLSGMVMPNIGAFIAWGLITALFIPTGWYPNEAIGALVSPMASMLLPLLIAYTGGSVVYGQRGGVIGAISAMGVIVGSGVPMFIGAMIVGPISAWVIKQFDRKIESKIPAGFEMLVNNFSLGIIGAILTAIALKGVVPFVEVMNRVMESGVGFFVDRKLLPLASIFIEPAKILFLNNAINHGILSPLGIQQVEEIGKSIFFLLEANPGPGLGVLLAYCLAGKGSARSSAPGAIIIHFLGGIHEIYFPYILMNPLLLLAVVSGGASGIFVFQLLGVGLTSPASPGSILAVLAMTPRGGYFGVLAGVTVATVVSFLVALPLLRFTGKGGDLEESTEKVKQMKQESKGNQTAEKKMIPAGTVKKIVFACDAGMGSSAMGATILKKKLAAAGFGDIEVVHSPVSSIPKDAQIVVTHKELKERASRSNPEAELILITNFMAAPEYDELVETLKNKQIDL